MTHELRISNAFYVLYDIIHVDNNKICGHLAI